MIGPELGRRELFAIGAAGLAVPVTARWPADPTETIALWPGPPPGAPPVLPPERVIERSEYPALRDRVAVNVATPTITLFRPRRSNGGAVLIIPGGAFIRVAIDKEGFETARWLAERGITAFVLRYRFPADGWRDGGLAPFQDAQRAMRVIRANTARLGIDPTRVGVIGFSAGGLLAALLGTAYDKPTYKPLDAVDRLRAKPSVVGLVYAATESGSAMPGASSGLAKGLIGRPASSLVTRGVAPSILFHAGDDTTVAPESSLRFYTALRGAGVPSALHVFENGGHGFGLRLPPESDASRWPELFLAFAARHGLNGV